MIDKEHDDNEQETSEMKSEEFALKTEVFAFTSRSKAIAKPRRCTSACSSASTVPLGERCWTDIEPGAYSNIAFPVSKRLSALLRHGDLLRKEDGVIEFWRLKDCLRYKITILDIGLMKCGIFLSPSSSRPFRTQSHWSFTAGQCVNSEQFLQVHFSHTMCSQFTLHHKFRIDTGRTNFKQGKTDSTLYGCESYEQGTQRSVWDWLERTTSCMVHTEEVEKTPENGVFGRHKTCSTERIEVLSNTIVRCHSSRNTSSLLYCQSCCDGIFRNHIRVSMCVTSTSSKDFL